MTPVLHRAEELTRFVLDAEDGEIGRVGDLLFSEEDWHVRYLRADTGKWLARRRVLIPRDKLGPLETEARRIAVALTREEIEAAPAVGLSEALTREHEGQLRKYYSMQPYWGGETTRRPSPSGGGTMLGAMRDLMPPGSLPAAPALSLLRGCREIADYDLHASDGGIGRLDDCIVDLENWIVRYLLIDLRAGLPGRKALIGPGWVEEIDFRKKAIRLDLPKDAIKESPRYDPAQPITAELEEQLAGHYSHSRFWE